MNPLALFKMNKLNAPDLATGSGTSKPSVIFKVFMFTLYIEQPLVKGRGLSSFSTCHWTPILPFLSSDTTSKQNLNDVGRESATLNKCFFKVSRP